ncbi:hypothetical protein D3C77_419750 [compost metagenome]
MTLQVVVPVSVEQALVVVLKIQLLDETLETLGRNLQVGRGVIAGGLGALEQAVEHQKRRAIVECSRDRQTLDDLDWPFGKGPGPGRREQGANQIIVGLSLLVGQHGLGQTHATDDHGLIAIWTIGVVMQGHHIDQIGIEGKVVGR